MTKSLIFITLLTLSPLANAGPAFDQLKSDFEKVMGNTGDLLSGEQVPDKMKELQCRQLDSDDQTSDGGSLIAEGETFKFVPTDDGHIEVFGLTAGAVKFIPTESNGLEAQFKDESLEMQVTIKALQQDEKLLVYIHTHAENLDVISTCEKPVPTAE